MRSASAAIGSRSMADFPPIAVAAVVFLGYLAFLPAGPYWLDAPEFLAAGWNLALPHPPGHPAMMPVLKAFLLLPVGDAAFRGNLFSAVFGALAAGLVARLAGSLARGAGTGDAGAAGAALAAGLGYGLSSSAVLQAMSVEVYTFHAALLSGALVLALERPGDARAGGVAGLLVGLGLANHHFLAILAGPAVVVAFLGRGTRVRAVAWAAGVGVAVGAACYLYLPVRGAVGAWPTWADTSTLDGVFWVASAAVFRGSLGGHGEAGVAGNMVQALGLVATTLGPAAPVLALGGLYILARAAGVRVATAVALWIGGGLASKVMMGILDPSNPDDHGYFLGALGGIAALAALAGAVLAAWGIRAARGARLPLVASGGAVLLVTAAVPLPGGWALGETRERFADARQVGRMLWNETPPRGVLMASHYPVFFQLQMEQAVDGARPDVTLVQQSFYLKARGGGFYARRLAREDPDLAALANAFLDRGLLDWDEVLRLAALRPVRLEAADDLPVPPGDVTLAGWTFAAGAGAGRGAAGSVEGAATAHLADLRRAFPWPDPDLETRRVLMRHLASSAGWLGAQGALGAAAAFLDAALELNPRDALLHRLRGQVERDGATVDGRR